MKSIHCIWHLSLSRRQCVKILYSEICSQASQKLNGIGESVLHCLGTCVSLTLFKLNIKHLSSLKRS